MKHAVNITEDVKGKIEEFKAKSEILAERLLEEKYATAAYEDIALNIDKLYNDPRHRRRAINTIIKMDNQEQFFEALSKYVPEATFTANFGTTPQAIIRSIRVANPNSIIEDICDVQTITSMVGMIGYIKPVFSRSIRGGVAGDLLVESKAKDYAAENIDEAFATTVAATKVYSAASRTYLPIRSGTVKIIYDGYEIAKDDGSGNITNLPGQTVLDTSTGKVNTVNYTTGAITITLLADPGNGIAILTNYNYDTEQNTDAHGNVELVWQSDGVKAEMHPLYFKFSLTSMLLAQSANFSVEEVLNDASTQYLKSERDRRGVEYNARLALSNSALAFDASPGSTDNNHKMRAQLLELAIESAGDAMYDELGRGGVSYIIAGSKAATYFNLLDNFTKDNSNSPIGCYRVGYLGKVPVIKARVNSLDTSHILVGYKSEWGEAPFIHADYLDYATESLTLRDFITQKGLASYYQNVKVEPKFVRKLAISNIPA